MLNKLTLQPIHSSSADILASFALGKPLTGDQLNYLDWHKRQLSSPVFDPVLKYYLKQYNSKSATSFLLPQPHFTPEGMQQFKKRIHALLSKNIKHVVVPFSEQQLLQFKEVGLNELIFWHGNQLLTGAPFYPGGVPPVIYFQWGNLLGIVKFGVLPGEKAIKGNILVYFEDRQERELNQYVAEYSKSLTNELIHQNNILFEHKIEPTSFNEFLIHMPVLHEHS